MRAATPSASRGTGIAKWVAAAGRSAEVRSNPGLQMRCVRRAEGGTSLG
jgi:hypothetical protein